MRRLQCDTALWHVFARGTRRLELFRDDDDFRQFLQILVFALEKSGGKVWTYALMSNHYHLVLEASSVELSKCMLRLNKLYSRYHNKRYGLVGHTFDGPYQAYRQRTFLLSLATIAYIFVNPVKAGICDHLDAYPWSSYRSFVGRPGSPLPVNPQPLLERMDPDLKRVWRLFHLGMRRELGRPPKQITGRPTMAEVHMSQFLWLLGYAKDHGRTLAGEDPLPVAAYWGRQSGIAPRVMAKALGMNDSRDLRNMLIAFGKRLRKEPALAHLATLP